MAQKALAGIKVDAKVGATDYAPEERQETAGVQGDDKGC